MVVIGGVVPIGVRIGWVRARLARYGVFFIVALGSGFDEGACVVEALVHVVPEEFVAHAVVSGLHEPAPPRLAWGMNAWSVSCSLAQRPKAAAMNSWSLSARNTRGAHGPGQPAEHVDHVGGSHWPLDAERWVLAGERIDSVTCLEDTPLPVGVELDGPHLPGSTSRDHGVGDAAWCGALRARTRRPFRARASGGTYRAQCDAFACGARPGSFVAPPSMRGGDIVHPLAHTPHHHAAFSPRPPRWLGK